MKKLLFFSVLLILSSTPGFAQDFIVEFMEENYKETQAQFSYDPLIYHSMQVNSSVGPKLLILTGNNYNYRKWLRHYIALNKKFIIKVPEDQIDKFVSSKAFEIDVTSLHPVNMDKWGKKGVTTENFNTIGGADHILIVDPNEKRTNLLQLIAKKMGYPTTIFKTGIQALESYKLQPDRFSMIIVHHTVEGISLEEFVNKILKISHTIPVVIATGYSDQGMKNSVTSKFSGSSSVYIKPVILKDLQKTIDVLIKKNV